MIFSGGLKPWPLNQPSHDWRHEFVADYWRWLDLAEFLRERK